MKKLIVSLLFLLFAVLPVRAEGLTAGEKTAVEGIITQQLNAFAAGNGAEAYSYAAPLIQQIFPDPESFMAMVKKGYEPVYRHQKFEFGASFSDNVGRPAQRVTITGLDGVQYEAVYTMEKQPDGTWKIAGCYLARVPVTGA